MGEGDRIQIPVTTIDKLVSELKLDRVDFIKMDIKGAEQQALTGASQVLERHKPRLAIAGEHMPDDPVRIPQIVRRRRPDYQSECGPCFMADWRIYGEVLYFR